MNVIQDWFNSVDYDTFDPYVPGLITSDWLHMHNNMGKRHMTWVSSTTAITTKKIYTTETTTTPIKNMFHTLFFKWPPKKWTKWPPKNGPVICLYSAGAG
jgi:hypothetical protein